MTTPMKEDISAWPSSNPAFRPIANVATDRRIRLALVEDDDDFREAVSSELEDHGFDVTGFARGTDLLDACTQDIGCEIILLDWNLPQVTGIDLLPKLRRIGVMLPVVFLTGHSEAVYEKLALDRGALDFIDKARGVPILAQRLRLIADSLKKLTAPELERNFHCGRLLLKPSTSRAFWDARRKPDGDRVQDRASARLEHRLLRHVPCSLTACTTWAIAGRGRMAIEQMYVHQANRNKFRGIDPDFAEIDNYQSFGYRWGEGVEHGVGLVGGATPPHRLAARNSSPRSASSWRCPWSARAVQADRRHTLVAIRTGVLIAAALTPALKETDPTVPMALNYELAKYGSDGTVLKLMFQPAADKESGRFYLVGSAPPIRSEAVSAELDELHQRGILQRLSEACIWDASNEIRYKQADGSIELLTSIIPIQARGNCWVLTSTHVTSEFLNTSIGRPYWETREIRIAAGIYLIAAVLGLLIALGIGLSLGRFRRVANEISQGRIGDSAFTRQNVVPELSSVARDFDKLVHELRRVSRQIRQSAEDNAHSFKTPIAAVLSALRPVRRAVPESDQRARRALEIVDSSLARLLALVNAAQHFDTATADLIEAPRVPTDLTLLVGEAARHFREILATRDIRLIRRLDERAMVRAGHGMLEVALQNVLENAISFSPNGSVIVVTLTANQETVELQVDDEGPGIDPGKIDHVFERYFSSRPDDGIGSDQSTEHSGLGLWMVRRNVESLGGQVSATNRIGSGLSVVIVLPRNGHQ